MNNMAFISKIPKVLNQFDKISMNFSIENRSPYLTPNIKNMNRLVLNQLYYKKKPKFIFRKILYDLTKIIFILMTICEQSPQPKFLLEEKFLKIEKIFKNKNSCDEFFIKKILLNI